MDIICVFCFSSRRRHTRCALVTGVQTCALPICRGLVEGVAARMPRRSRFENQISRASAHAAAGNGVGGPFPIIKWLDEMHAAGSAGPTLQGDRKSVV